MVSMRIIYFTFFLGMLFQCSLLRAQVSTDLWVVDTEGKGGQLKMLSSTAKPLTNRPEYDNQPSFINDSELIFSAADEKGNHDLILYSFEQIDLLTSPKLLIVVSIRQA